MEACTESNRQTWGKSKLEVSNESLYLEMGNSVGKHGKKDCVEDTRRTWPTESINKRYLGWQIVRQQGWGLQECVPCSVHICYDWWFGEFVILLTVGAGVSNSFACFWDSFYPIWWPFPTSVWGLLTCLIVPSFAHFCCYPLEACPFLKTKLGEYIWGKKKMGVAWRSEGRGNCYWEVLHETRIYFQ